MPTVINNPGNGEGSGAGLIVGVIVAIALAGLFIIYGIPALRNNQASQGTKSLDVNVTLPSTDKTSAPAGN